MQQEDEKLFTQFVKDDDDVVGHVAYALFMREERADSEHPAIDKKHYRERAKIMLNHYLSRKMPDVMQQLKEDYLNNQEIYLGNVISRNKPSFWTGVGQTLVGLTAFSAIAAAIAFIIRC